MHLLPAAALVAALLLGWLQPWPGALHNFIGQVGAILVCLCGSVTYHTLMAHQQKYRVWLAVDVSFCRKHFSPRLVVPLLLYLPVRAQG